jgi:hypothetical protein
MNDEPLPVPVVVVTSLLPVVEPMLVAETVDGLPGRLRAKLEAAAAASAGWGLVEWMVDDVPAGGLLVRLPGGVEVRLTPEDGVLRRADQVTCACLLAPSCLHRAAVLTAAPLAQDEDEDEPSTEPAAQPMSMASPPAEPSPWRPAELAAAESVRLAAARVLDSGLAGAGAAVQSDLLRAVHIARLAGLHRLAAAATRLVTGIRANRSGDASFSLDGLTEDLLEVLELAHAVNGRWDDAPYWRGRARSEYTPVGGLRLTGLCLEPVLSTAGYAGVVVWLIDADGRTWSVSDVKPGGPERIAMSAGAVVAFGEAGLTHRRLSRAGMTLSGATANPDGRLGAGAKVRAVSAAGTAWTAAPLNTRFGPLPAVASMSASSPSGPSAHRTTSLLLLDLTICAATPDAVLAIDSAGRGVRLEAPTSAQNNTFRDNLRLLGAAPGLRLFAVGRRSTRSAATVELLAVGGGDLHLPLAFGGHADLGIDRLSAAFLTPSIVPPIFPELPETPDPLLILRRRLRRVVTGGRRTVSAPGVQAQLRADVAALRRAHLRTGADLLAGLLASAQAGERDLFGRLVLDDPAALSRAWLTAGIYARETATALLTDDPASSIQ